MSQKRNMLFGLGAVLVLGVAVLVVVSMMRNQEVSSALNEPEEDAGLAAYCGGTGSVITLDRAFRVDPARGSVPREFTTNGGKLMIVLNTIQSTGPLDLGLHADVAIGWSDTDWKIKDNALVEIDATEDEYSSFTLDPGTYWLWVSAGRDIDIISCERENLSLVTYEE